MGMIPLEEYLKDPKRPKLAPIEYAGQWVVWDARREKIIAHGPDFVQVRKDAILAGHPDPLFEKVRNPDQHYMLLGWR